LGSISFSDAMPFKPTVFSFLRRRIEDKNKVKYLELCKTWSNTEKQSKQKLKKIFLFLLFLFNSVGCLIFRNIPHKTIKN
jgi:hypothetical protein